MIPLKIPSPLRPYAEGQAEVLVEGSNVAEALNDLVRQHPALKKHLFTDSNELRPFIHLFLGEENVRQLQGLNTPLKAGDRLMIIPSIAGGCREQSSPSLHHLPDRG